MCPALHLGQGYKEISLQSGRTDGSHQVPDPILRDQRGRRLVLVILKSKGKAWLPFLALSVGAVGNKLVDTEL